MGKLNFDIDEASLLKTYGLSTLAPTYVPQVQSRTVSEKWRHSEWEDTDHDLGVPLAGSVTSDGDTSDPLGLGGTLECVNYEPSRF
jgi:exocyst complex component 2